MLNRRDIPYWCVDFYEELEKICYILRSEYNRMTTLSFNKKYAISAMEYIKSLLSKLGSSVQYMGLEEEVEVRPVFFISGEEFFLRGSYGVSIVVTFEDDCLVIDPISPVSIVYFTKEGKAYANGVIINKKEVFAEELSYHNYSNGLLLFWKAVGKTKKIILNPECKLQSLSLSSEINT